MKRYMNIFCLVVIIPLHAVITVDRSGIYIYSSDILYTSTIVNDAIIRINVNNVTLNFKDGVITQMSDLPQNLNGIEIAPNLSNITIKNGTITGITGIGIIINAGCSNVVVDNMITMSCDGGGIHVLGTPSNKVTSFDINNCRVVKCCQGPVAQKALFLYYCADFRLVNCRANNNGITTHDISALYLDSCSSGRFFDVRANNNIGALNIRGFDCSAITDCLFFNCFASNNNPTVANGISIGFELRAGTLCMSNTFQECLSFVHKAMVNGGTVCGFCVRSTNSNNIFDRCKALDNTSTSDATGFLCDTSLYNSFIDCFARGNSATTGIARGFYDMSGTGNKFVRCFANEHTSTDSIAIGIDTNADTECLFQECSINRNYGSSNSNSYGLRQTSGTDNIFIKNIAEHNGTTAGNQLNGLSPTQRNNITPNQINSVLQPWTNIGIT